jgi:hemerythrin-like domain-containing protein
MHPLASAQRPTQILMAEHEVILQALACLERVAKTAASGVIDVVSAEDLLDFLAVFADRCHHAKEEECLFPRLVERGLPRDAGPLAVMLDEHEEGRQAVGAMSAALQALGRGERAAGARFAAAARAYTELLRAHIDKENQVLFPMADGMLDAGAQDAVLKAFGRLETEDLRTGTHERYVKLIENLVRRLGVTPADLPRAGSCCGHALSSAGSRTGAPGA